MIREKVLVIDDESSVRELVSQVLSEKYHVILATNGEQGIEIAKSQQPNAIVVDLMMPGMSGLDACRVLRNDPRTERIPLLMLTGLNMTEQRIEAFRGGIDDFLEKPFHPNELIARVAAKIERFKGQKKAIESNTLRLGSINVDLLSFQAQMDGQPLELGLIEFKILSLLMRHPNQVVARREIENFIWGEKQLSERALDPHITSLRKKIGPGRVVLKMFYGSGYSLMESK